MLKYFEVLHYMVITKHSYFIITMSKLIYSLIDTNITRVVFLLFLMPSESYMEYREY